MSIGCMCATAEELKRLNFRIHSYPLDWLFSSSEVIEHCINDKFIKFLDTLLLHDITPE